MCWLNAPIQWHSRGVSRSGEFPLDFTCKPRQDSVTPRYARPRGRSHNTSSALTCSPHLEGSASSRSPPRRDQRGRRATHASDPPPHTSHSQGTNAARLQRRQSQSSNSSSLSETQQPLRLRAGGWATNGRLQSTHLRTRGAPTTRRAGADRAPPSAGPPRSDARHTRRSDPESTAGAGAAAAIPHLTMHACARPVPRLPPPGGKTHAPPSGPPHPR